MKIYYDMQRMKKKEKGVITIGTFDGLHRGHWKIMNRVIEEAGRLGGESIVITFRNHPIEVIEKGVKRDWLLRIEEKLSLLEGAGIENVILLEFDEGFRMKSHEEFMMEVRGKVGVIKMILGRGWKFGEGKKGNINYLKGLVNGEDFDLEELKEEKLEEKLEARMISSSEIRRLIKKGEVGRGNEMLGREYSLKGRVERGRGFGKKLGYATMNLRDRGKVYPKEGVYQTRTRYENKDYESMSYIWGEENEGLIESHLFNFNIEIYGQEVEIYFKKRLRGSFRFKDEEELKEQLRKDEVNCFERI